jgi:hypothetical protein
LYGVTEKIVSEMICRPLHIPGYEVYLDKCRRILATNSEAKNDNWLKNKNIKNYLLKKENFGLF